MFQNVTTPSCIFVVEKSLTPDHHTLSIDLSRLEDNQQKSDALSQMPVSNLIPQVQFKTNADLDLQPPLVIKASQNIQTLGNTKLLQCRDAGINYQRVGVGMLEKGKSDLSERLLYEGKQQNPIDMMYWKGTDIDRYWIDHETQRWCRPYYNQFIRDNETVTLNTQVFNTTPKILLRQTADTIKATMDYRGIWFGRSIIAIVPTNNTIKAEYFLGILNSKYIAYLYSSLAKEDGRVFAQVKLSKLKQLPIRTIDFENPAEVAQHDRMVKLVGDMLELHKRLSAATTDHARQPLQRQLDATDHQIDKLVYELYGLSAAEIAIVEGKS